MSDDRVLRAKEESARAEVRRNLGVGIEGMTSEPLDAKPLSAEELAELREWPGPAKDAWPQAVLVPWITFQRLLATIEALQAKSLCNAHSDPLHYGFGDCRYCRAWLEKFEREADSLREKTRRLQSTLQRLAEPDEAVLEAENPIESQASELVRLRGQVAAVKALCDDSGYTWKPNDELLPIISADKVRAILSEET